MTREEMARIALRYETNMARAMCKALGIEPRKSRPKTSKPKRYKGVRQCFGQRYGVRM